MKTLITHVIVLCLLIPRVFAITVFTPESRHTYVRLKVNVKLEVCDTSGGCLTFTFISVTVGFRETHSQPCPACTPPCGGRMNGGGDVVLQASDPLKAKGEHQCVCPSGLNHDRLGCCGKSTVGNYITRQIGFWKA